MIPFGTGASKQPVWSRAVLPILLVSLFSCLDFFQAPPKAFPQTVVRACLHCHYFPHQAQNTGPRSVCTIGPHLDWWQTDFLRMLCSLFWSITGYFWLYFKAWLTLWNSRNITQNSTTQSRQPFKCYCTEPFFVTGWGWHFTYITVIEILLYMLMLVMVRLAFSDVFF